MTHHWIGHEVILREVVFEAKLKCEEPLRIGVGRASARLTTLADLPVFRVGMWKDGEYVDEIWLPGSSIKGALRATTERLARQRELKVCSGLGKDSCMSRDDAKLEKYIDDLISKGNIELAKEKLRDHLCLQCKIYGSPTFQSHVRVLDARPIRVSVGTKYGVAIGRRRGTVEVGPFQLEYVSPGSVFSFRLETFNLPNYALGLLVAGLKEFQSGRARLGGFKSRGFGRVSFSEWRITVAGAESQEGAFLLPRFDDIDSDVAFKTASSMEGGVLILEGDEALDLLDKLANVWLSLSEEAIKALQPKELEVTT